MQRAFIAFAMVFALAAASTRVSAAPIHLDFENLSESDVIGALLPEVVFTNAVILTASAAGGALNDLDYPPRSGFNVAFDSGGPMRLDFASTIDSFTAFFTYASPVILRAFDTADNELASIASAFGSNYATGGNTPNEALTLAFAGISYLTIAGAANGGSFVMDDVTFNTTPAGQPIPEPGTVVLFGTALAVVVGRQARSLRRRG